MAFRRIVYTLADSPRVTGWISERGMRWGFARRFIAGESFAEATAAVRELLASGLRVTLDYLGEAVTDEAAARAATDEYCAILERIAASGLAASISLKPTQLGLAIAPQLARANIRRVAQQALRFDNFVRVDMEDSSTTQATLDVYRSLLPECPNLGAVVQAYLYRTEADVRALNALGARLRLCKGAYREPAEVAFQDKAAIDANYLKLAELLLREGTYPAFATHDDRIIDQIIDTVEREGIPRDAFEFQMLYGVRREYQRQIARSGYRIRIYVPFGRQWCPYFMRRIAERPANALFVLRALTGD